MDPNAFRGGLDDAPEAQLGIAERLGREVLLGDVADVGDDAGHGVVTPQVAEATVDPPPRRVGVACPVSRRASAGSARLGERLLQNRDVVRVDELGHGVGQKADHLGRVVSEYCLASRTGVGHAAIVVEDEGDVCGALLDRRQPLLAQTRVCLGSPCIGDVAHVPEDALDVRIVEQVRPIPLEEQIAAIRGGEGQIERSLVASVTRLDRRE